MGKTSGDVSRKAGYSTRWHSLKSNPLTSAAMGIWGRKIVVPRVHPWVFCIATGRCGTNTLADMLALHPDICAEHEPYPQPSREVLEACGRGDFSDMQQLWAADKFPRMAFAARNSKVYLETTHLYVHTFVDLSIKEFGDKLKVVHLHRDVDKTVRSFMQRNQDPKHDPWLIRPDAPDVVLQMRDDLATGGAFDDIYFRLFWYCHEVRARAERLKTEHPNIELIDFPTEKLNSKEAVTDLLARFGLNAPAAVLDKCGVRSNVAKTKVAPVDLPSDAQRAEFLGALQGAYEKAGLSFG